MRIGHFYRSLGRSADGAGLSTLALCQALQSIPGVEITRYNAMQEFTGNADTPIIALDLDYQDFTKSLFSKSVKPSLENVLLNLDLIHLHGGYFSLETITLGKIANLLNLPYVYTPHAIIHNPAMGPQNLKKKIFNRLLGLPFLNRAAWVQGFTLKEKELLKQYGVKVPIKVIPIGIDPVHLDGSSNSAAFLSDIPRPWIGFLGRLDIWTKGLDLLLSGFAELVQRLGHQAGSLVIAGPDWYESRAALEAMAQNLKISQKVRFVGEVPREQVVPFLRDLDLFILPSRMESFGRVILEACASGCPVVVTHNACISDMVKNYQIGLSVAFSVPELADGMEWMLKHPDWREQMGANGKVLAKEMTWEKVALQMIGAYKESIGDYGRKRLTEKNNI